MALAHVPAQCSFGLGAGDIWLIVKLGRGMVQEIWNLVFDQDGDGYYDNEDYYGGHNDYLIETE
jgi:hypothetical protein